MKLRRRGRSRWSIDVVRRPEWPTLAWRAHCPRGERRVDVEAGTGVETGADWLCEAVWDGPFTDADFDRTELVFGSGLRVRGDEVTFVSCGSTSDRLHLVVDRRGLTVANSLPCLLAGIGAELRDDVDYRPLLFTIRNGIYGYEPILPTTAGEVTLVYFDNVVWDGETMRHAPKPQPQRDLSTFAAYRALLRDSMAGLVANLGDAGRARPFGTLSTCSAGYDSSTVTVVAHEAGCGDAMGLLQTRQGRDDSGAAVADALGMRFHGFASNAWRETDRIESRFLAAGLAGGSSIPFLAAEDLMAGRVLFTGYHGDKMWDRETEDLGPHHARADLGGCDLQEYRLSVGFIQVMFPFVASNQMVDVHALTESDEMKPWKVGGRYDRPICRRIIEEAGVPRGAFATKKGAMQQWHVLTPASELDVADWVAAHRPGADPDDAEQRAEHLFAWAVARETARYR